MIFLKNYFTIILFKKENAFQLQCRYQQIRVDKIKCNFYFRVNNFSYFVS